MVTEKEGSKITIRMTKDLYKTLHDYSWFHRMTITAIIDEALTKYFKGKHIEPAPPDAHRTNKPKSQRTK